MTNIEKFNKLKKLSALKAQLHGYELESFFCRDKYVKEKETDYLEFFNKGYSLYQLILPLLKQK